MDNIIKSVFAVVGGTISWLIGGWGLLLTVLLIFNFLDFITGMAANWGSINSARGYQGIKKKLMMWVWIVVGNLIYLVLLDMGYSIGQVIPDGVALLFIINELISLGENSIKIGLDMPAPIKKALEIFNNHKEGERK